MTAQPYNFSRKGRSWTTLIALLAAWIVCLFGWTVLEVRWWLVVGVFVLSLPAVWDFWASTDAGMTVSDTEIAWNSGPRTAAVALGQIDHVRLVTRLDLSVRAALVLTSGRKLRVPAESTPPSEALEAALIAQGVKITRHHFTPL